MASLSSYEIIKIIKSDDLATFSVLINNKKTLLKTALGRFPILTLCYMYRSRKILRKYEKDLINIKEYNQIEEPLETLLDFKRVAGRCLRLYKEGTMVSPIEMLAILHMDHKVKRLYSKYLNDADIISRLNTIYNYIYCQNTYSVGNKISITPIKLTTYQKRVVTRLQIILIALIVSIMAIGGVFIGVMGDGVVIKSKILSGRQFISAIKSGGGEYKLKKDLIIDEEICFDEFSGEMDGAGYTITIVNHTKDYLIENLSGCIKNLNIVYADKLINSETSQSFFVKENNGIIDNVNVTINSDINYTKTSDDQGGVSVICAVNNNTIQNCNLSLNLNINSSGEGDGLFAGIVGENAGEINNCIIDKNSNIITNNCDVSGIVGINQSDGKIRNCSNYASISQHSNQSGWFPMVAGIVGINYGVVEEAINYSDLKLIDTNNDTTILTYSTIGGVCALNYNLINKSLNYGEIYVENTSMSSYVGGICGKSDTLANSTKASVVEACGNNSIIKIVTSTPKVYSFVGGVVGFLQGNIWECYSNTTFNQLTSKDNYYQGGLVGGCYISTILMGNQIIITDYYIGTSNNCYLANENIYYGIGGFLNLQNYIFFNDSIEYSGILKCDDINALYQSEVYWDEK